MVTRRGSTSSGTEELSVRDHREVEWQFDAGELGPVERWLGRHSSGSSGLVVAPDSTVGITDSYCDTDDWRLYRAGYALEFVSEVYGEPVQKLVRPLKALQDDLGDHQDPVVAAGFPNELGTTTSGTRVPRAVAFTMGVYSERCSREAQDLCAAVPDAKPFRALKKGKQWKKFEKVLENQKTLDLPDAGLR